MPKVTIEFSEEEPIRARQAMASSRLFSAVWLFLEHDLHGKLDHGHDMEHADEALEWSRDQLLRRLRDHGVDIHELA